MKSAEKMFEQLGWYLDIETNKNQIVYAYDIKDKKTFGYLYSKTITFDLKFGIIYFDEVSNLTLNELQAINKQVEELHWNE